MTCSSLPLEHCDKYCCKSCALAELASTVAKTSAVMAINNLIARMVARTDPQVNNASGLLQSAVQERYEPLDEPIAAKYGQMGRITEVSIVAGAELAGIAIAK